MNIYFTTTSAGQDTRTLPSLPLGESWGLKLAYWSNGTSNNLATNDGPGWTAFGQASVRAGADATIIDREAHQAESPADLVRMVQWVRAANGGKPIFCYSGAAGYTFAQPAGMTSWSFIDPNASEELQCLRLAQLNRQWVAPAGTALVGAQVGRPIEHRTVERLISRQATLIRQSCDTATPVVFMQDTWNWSQFSPPDLTGLPAQVLNQPMLKRLRYMAGWPSLPESMCRRIFSAAAANACDVCIFQPLVIDTSYPYRPLWDVLGEYLVCPQDRQQGGRP